MTPELAAAGVTELELRGPYDPVADAMHPDGAAVEPAMGGRIIVHEAGEPPHLNYSMTNASAVRSMYRSVHAALLDFDPVSWEYEPVLAIDYDVEDRLILAGGRGEGADDLVFGAVAGFDDGYVVTSGSRHNATEPREFPASEVQSLERGTVYTFRLREDALWHDGHPFDAEDVLFSWQILANPHADCGVRRYRFEDVQHVEVLEPHVVRFFWKEQYFATTSSFGYELPILPSHLYNLSDPDNPDFDPSAGPEAQGEFFNESPHNREWVGLGPYRVTQWDRGQFVQAERFDRYWDDEPGRAGYVDTIRWRFIPSTSTAWSALLNGEVHVFDRVSTSDYFGAGTQSATFTDRFYKALTYVGNVGCLVWNVRRPHLADVRVRRALAHAYDMRGWIDSNYKGHALWATFTMFWFGPGYDHAAEPLAYDPERAEELLLEAGWYDRDGDGIVDKDGQPFVLEVVAQAGNSSTLKLFQSLQDAYRKIGVKVDIQTFEWGTLLHRMEERAFDACFVMWGLSEPESDPYQQWHSSQAGGGGSNYSGLADGAVDRLIEQGRRERDPLARHRIWQELHRRIQELQPCLFGFNVPRKLAFDKQVRGVKLYKWTPGYRLRDLYYAAGTPGTRPIGE